MFVVQKSHILFKNDCIQELTIKPNPLYSTTLLIVVMKKSVLVILVITSVIIFLWAGWGSTILSGMGVLDLPAPPPPPGISGGNGDSNSGGSAGDTTIRKSADDYTIKNGQTVEYEIRFKNKEGEETNFVIKDTITGADYIEGSNGGRLAYKDIISVDFDPNNGGDYTGELIDDDGMEITLDEDAEITIKYEMEASDRDLEEDEKTEIENTAYLYVDDDLIDTDTTEIEIHGDKYGDYDIYTPTTQRVNYTPQANYAVAPTAATLNLEDRILDLEQKMNTVQDTTARIDRIEGRMDQLEVDLRNMPEPVQQKPINVEELRKGITWNSILSYTLIALVIFIVGGLYVVYELRKKKDEEENIELISEYLNNYIQQGYDKEVLIEHLKANGWGEEVIQKAEENIWE